MAWVLIFYYSLNVKSQTKLIKNTRQLCVVCVLLPVYTIVSLHVIPSIFCFNNRLNVSATLDLRVLAWFSLGTHTKHFHQNKNKRKTLRYRHNPPAQTVTCNCQQVQFSTIVLVRCDICQSIASSGHEQISSLFLV